MFAHADWFERELGLLFPNILYGVTRDVGCCDSSAVLCRQGSGSNVLLIAVSEFYVVPMSF